MNPETTSYVVLIGMTFIVAIIGAIVGLYIVDKIQRWKGRDANKKERGSANKHYFT